MEPRNPKALGDVLRMARLLLDLTCKEVAEAAEVSVATLANIERGQPASRRETTLRRIARVLRLSPQAVIDEDYGTLHAELNALVRKRYPYPEVTPDPDPEAIEVEVDPEVASDPETDPEADPEADSSPPQRQQVDRTAFAEGIRYLRTAFELTEEQFADFVECDPQLVRRAENPQYRLSTHEMRLLCDAFEATPEQVCNRDLRAMRGLPIFYGYCARRTGRANLELLPEVYLPPHELDGWLVAMQMHLSPDQFELLERAVRQLIAPTEEETRE